MEEIIVLFAFFSILFLLWLVYFLKIEKLCGSFFLGLGTALLIAFGVSMGNITTGLPLTKIDDGSYKVISVYDSSDRVSLWIEELGEDKEKHLLFYQFPKAAFKFEGDINKDAKELVVTQIKRLHLQ